MSEIPDELWEKICHNAVFEGGGQIPTFATALTLSRTSRQLRRLALPLAYQHVDIFSTEGCCKFASFLRTFPDVAQLVRSLRIGDWTFSGMCGLQKDQRVRELEEIAREIGPRLDRFTYEHHNDSNVIDTQLEPAFELLLRHAKSVRIYYRRTKKEYSYLSSTFELVSLAARVEELVLSFSVVPRTYPCPPRTLSSLKRLVIHAVPNEDSLTHCIAEWIPSLNALEELVLPSISHVDKGLEDLTRYFRSAGSGLRNTFLGTSGSDVSELVHRNWEDRVFALLQALPHLKVLHLDHALRPSGQLFRHLPDCLEVFCCEFDPSPVELDTAEAFIGAFEAYVLEHKGTLKKVHVAHGLHNISVDTNARVEGFMKEGGVDDVRFVYGSGKFTFWKVFKKGRARRYISRHCLGSMEHLHTIDVNIDTLW